MVTGHDATGRVYLRQTIPASDIVEQTRATVAEIEARIADVEAQIASGEGDIEELNALRDSSGGGGSA